MGAGCGRRQAYNAKDLLDIVDLFFDILEQDLMMKLHSSISSNDTTFELFCAWIQSDQASPKVILNVLRLWLEKVHGNNAKSY